MMQKGRLKMLAPSLREKERYVRIKAISEAPITYADLEAAIYNSLLDFYGEVGVSQMSVWLVKDTYSEAEQTLVIRCNNRSVEKVIAGLGLISRLGDSRMVVKTLKVSGTIKGLG